MIYLKTAWLTAKKSIISNILTVIQLAVALAISVVMVSSVLIRYQYYAPFKDYFNSTGIFTTYFDYANSDPTTGKLYNMMDKEDILKSLDGSVDMISCYGAMLDDIQDPDHHFRVMIYDNAIIERYQPELSDGRWLRVTNDKKRVEAVVSQNSYNWKVGDIITIVSNNHPEFVEFEVEIVGVLNEGTRIVGNFGLPSEKTDYNSFYTPFSYAIEQIPLLIFSHDALANLSNSETSQLACAVPQAVRYGSLIRFKDTTDTNSINSAMEQLNHYGITISENMAVVKENSMQYLMQQIKKLLPTIIIALLLVVVSTISSSALSTKKNMRNYVIFTINGLPWRRCILINLLQSLMVLIASWLFSFICLYVINRMFDSVTIIWSFWLPLFYLLIGFVYILISLVMPILMIWKSTPKQLLTN